LKLQLLLVAITFAAVPLSFVDAPYPEELVLQHVPTLFGLACLTAVVLFAAPTWLSFACVLTFLWLHILGARWIYSFVPYDEVIRHISGTSLSDYLGWERNHYDRMVHFASGVLGVPPASELLQRFGGMRPLGAAIMGIACVMTIGACYEILEWQIAQVFSPAQAEAYNGQQGDVWDPQKDMALAGIGALMSAGLLFRWRPNSASS
jgi:putative membrane protein